MAIVDLSKFQNPTAIDYDVLASQLDFAIIRTQYGSNKIDEHYLTHHDELRTRGINTHAYAFVRGVSESDMQEEAKDFYDRTIELNPYFWWLDIEEISMPDMRAGIKAYVAKLRELGVQRIGSYISHNLYKQMNIDTNDFDAIWIPRYGANNGQPDEQPDFPCDIWQYTSKGRLNGYGGNLDLNQLHSDKPLSFFLGTETVQAQQTNPDVYAEVTCNTLNVRTGTGTNYGLLSEYPQLSNGNAVIVKESYTNGWSQVLILDKYIGYVNHSYLTAHKHEVDGGAAINRYQQWVGEATERIKVRTAPGTWNDQLPAYPYLNGGDGFDVLGEENDKDRDMWYKVSIQGNVGYVYHKYVRRT